MKPTILPILVAALVVAPAPAVAATQPDPVLGLAPTAGAAPGQSLTLKARCAKRCKLRLRELNVMRFDKRAVQGAGSSSLPLKVTKTLPGGKTVAVKLALGDSTGALARKLVGDGEYARVSVLADYSGADGARQVQRSIALHKPGMKRLGYADDDAALRPPAKPKRKVSRYSVTVSAVQRTDWSYNRDEARGPGCTVISNGKGTQILRFSPKEAVRAKLTHRPDGKPYFDRRPSTFSQLFVGGKLSVDRQGERNAGVSGSCDGEVGGGGGGVPPACNGKATFDATVFVEYFPDGRLSGYRLPTEDLPWVDRGVDCPVEVGQRSQGPLELMYALEGKADPTKAGDPGKYIVILRGKRTEPLAGGSVTTTVRYTVTFRKRR
jgi:hypothetical protein